MNKLKILLIFLLAGNGIVQAQSPKTVVAIMPFVSSSSGDLNRAAQLQAIAVECLRSKSNIQLIDRSNDTLLRRELITQMGEGSINAQHLAQQGDISGAEDIFVGKVSSVSAEQRQVNGMFGTNSTKYLGNITYSLEIMDASTGLQKALKNFTGNTGAQDFTSIVAGNTKLGKANSMQMADTKEQAIINAINATKNDILAWVNTAYSNIKILSVDSKDNNSLPATVLVTGLAGIKKNTSITVNEITSLDDGNGGTIKRVQKVFELKVVDPQGDVTICKVTDGANVVEDKMKNATLQFVINKKLL